MPKTTNAKDKTAFQYILCYGSTSNSNLTITDSGIFQYILCYGSTSNSNLTITDSGIFQYILCYGSTTGRLRDTIAGFHFNTSYVTVQHFMYAIAFDLKIISIHLMLRFNFVYSNLLSIPQYISIHLMLRFNPLSYPDSKEHFIFQYILCYGST